MPPRSPSPSSRISATFRRIPDVVYRSLETALTLQCRQLTYSRPGRAGTAPSRAPCLGRKRETFLPDEPEQQIGCRDLRSQ